jgi:hypothetical protein
MLCDVTYGHVIFGSKEDMHPLKWFLHLCNGNRAVYQPLRDVDNRGRVNYVFFFLLAKMHYDFSVEIVVILRIAAEDKKDFVGIVSVWRMGKCQRLGNGEQLDFNWKSCELSSNATFLGAYVERGRPSLFQWFLDNVLPVLGLGHFDVASFSFVFANAPNIAKVQSGPIGK